MSLLRVEHLGVAFGPKQVVRDVSFSLDPGETLALVGESGSGKSLTALSILQLLPHGASNEGRVTFDGYETIGAPESKLQKLRGGRAGMIFQEPMTSLNPLHSIGRQVSEAIALHQPMSRSANRKRVIETLTNAGFADAQHRLAAFPHQLSGGQRQRVMIAMALANDPALLIADEPTTALDVTIQAQILALLDAQRMARGLALLLITHDLAVVRRHADRVCVMQDGRIVETGRVADVFRAPQHQYTRALLAAEPSGGPMELPPAPATLLQAQDIHVAFPIRRGMMRRTVGHVRAVNGVSITVHEGETVGLVGESGSGKSTMGFACLGLQPCEGHVLVESLDLAAADKRARRRMRARAQIVFQDPYGSLSPRLSVAAIVAEGLSVHEPRLSRAQRERRVEDALAEVGLDPASATRFPHEFSGGQRQRIAIARAIILRPRFIVLDEPTSALDMSVQAQIVNLLRRLQQAHGLGYLFISHDLRVIRALAHRVLVMCRGVVVEEGSAERIFTKPGEDYTRALIAAALTMEVSEPDPVAVA